tara:strand:- start:708 stop:1706 length:999 start_codon:yes stop_codon:yes gene_type:complete
MGFIKKIGKFLKKSTRDIATVVGFAIGGPAGAAIGQGIGSLAEGRGLKKSAISALKVRGGTAMLQGAGLQGGQGLSSLNPFSQDFLLRPSNILSSAGGKTVTSGGLPGLFESMGADFQNLLTGNMAGASLTSPAFKGLSTLEKGILAGGLLSAAGGVEGLTEDEQTRFTTPDYFGDRLGGAGAGGGLSGAISPFPTETAAGIPTGTLVDTAMADPLQAIILDEIRKREQQDLFELPTFDIVTPAKDGGVIRLADGGKIPEVDLREHGGDISDPMGSGDKDTVPALLADGEFVMTKQAVKGIGGGDHSKGISNLYAMMNKNEKKAQSMGIGRA